MPSAVLGPMPLTFSRSSQLLNARHSVFTAHKSFRYDTIDSARFLPIPGSRIKDGTDASLGLTRLSNTASQFSPATQKKLPAKNPDKSTHKITPIKNADDSILFCPVSVFPLKSAKLIIVPNLPLSVEYGLTQLPQCLVRFLWFQFRCQKSAVGYRAALHVAKV